MGSRDDWTISAAVTALIARAIADFVKDYSRPDFAYYPLITWRAGGQATRPNQAPTDMPDRYDLALIPRTDLHASNFVAIADPQFEVVAFVPRDEDAASGRRLIDYDGRDIVVR
jgi:hypothetical protein